MSKEMAVAFIEKARTDTGIQSNLFGITSDNNFDKIIELASGLGYPFSELDFNSAARDVVEADGFKIEELTESDLETVAGRVIDNLPSMTPRATITSGDTSVVFTGGSINRPPSTGRAQH